MEGGEKKAKSQHQCSLHHEWTKAGGGGSIHCSTLAKDGRSTAEIKIHLKNVSNGWSQENMDSELN